MKKGPESILDSKTDGLREDYQSIPELTIHDIASLEDLALDQDRREKFYSSSVRRRSWLALFTLFLVGGVTLWSSIADQTAESVSLVEEKGLAVLSTETDVDEGYNLSLESFETRDSQCGGPIVIPPDFFPSSSANERPQCTELTGIIRGGIGGGLALLLSVIGGNNNGPGHIGTLLDLLTNTIWSLICNGYGDSPAYVEYADVVAISKRVFNQEMRGLISNRLVHLTRKLDTDILVGGGFKWEEVVDYAEKFEVISNDLSELGFEGNAIFFTAGEMNLLLLDVLRTYATNEMDQPCVDWVTAHIKRSSGDFLNGWQKIFEDYTLYVGNLTAPERVEFSKSGPQGCNNPFRGFTYYIWTAYVNVPNTMVKFENVTSDRSKGDCPSDNSQKGNARNKLTPLIREKIKSDYRDIIPLNVSTFFDNLCDQVNREGDWAVDPRVCSRANRYRWSVGLEPIVSIGPRPRMPA